MKKLSLIIIIGLVLIGLITIRPVESFMDMPDKETIELLMKAKDTKLPDGLDPETIIQNLRTLLNKYDNPELWKHAKLVHDMKPDALARMNLNI